MTGRLRRLRERGERGSFAVELAILAPVLFAVLMIITDAGRLAWANARVQSAARDGARAVTANHNTTADAYQLAIESATQALTDGNVCTGGPAQIVVTPPPWAPGDAVTVQVTCQVSLVGLGSKTVSRTAMSRLDVYREAPGYNGTGNNG